MFTRLIRAILAAWFVLLSASVLAQTKMVVGYTPANDFLAAFVAKDKGFFEKRGLDVTLTRIPNGSTIPAAMMSGSLTVGAITPTIFLQANDNGIDLRILSGASLQTSKNPTASVVVRNELAINSPADFTGKRIGVPGLNSVMHAMFMRWLKQRGVDPDKVTFVEVPFPQQLDLLKAGQVDAVLPVEPFRGRILQAQAGKAYANFFSDVRDNLLFSFFAVRQDWARRNPKEAQAFREALIEAQAFIAASPAEARKSQITHLGLPAAVADVMPLATYETKVELADVRFWSEVSKELDIIRTIPDPRSLVVQ
jgi:NitT/TauT family transport system substrate-binding protein